MTPGPNVAYLVEARAQGGTSAAVAAELRATRGLARTRVHALGTRMFTGDAAAPVLADALDDLGLPLETGAPTVSADLVILHNPSFLRFGGDPAPRVLARDLIVVTHENFCLPGGGEAFDVAACLDATDRSAHVLSRWLAPVSPVNRAGVAAWLSDRPAAARRWRLWPGDWVNICDFPLLPPTAAPADRRGRLSRPGPEKFPDTATMERLFPPTARANVILGADLLTDQGHAHPHWTLLPFRSRGVGELFAVIDFFVYFTAPTWRESFGRVLAEAIAAGKVAISDPGTAAGFGGGVIGADPGEVDGIVARLIADPAAYGAHVARAQAGLAAFSPEGFRARFADLLGRYRAQAAA